MLFSQHRMSWSPKVVAGRIAGWLVVMEVCLGLGEQYREAIGGAVRAFPA